MAALNADKGPLFKVVLLGEAGVGKTAIFHRAKDNSFQEKRKNTVGIDSFSMYIKVGDQQVTLGVWDTAGVERFRTITNSYYRGSHAAVLVYSVDEPSSLHYLGHWIRDLEEHAPNAKKVLVGNKKDLKCQISTETVELFNTSNECTFCALTSAKTGEGIQDIFKDIAELLVQGYQENSSKGTNLDLDSADRRGGCCS
ncbi:ras-related protein Rab-14-like [Montipora capricornis]|uniref:ras-related protein Rab-14-like n=1 Tax=Montipora capricornis TaxID=246305 RepID=UPI0035F190F2